VRLSYLLLMLTLIVFASPLLANDKKHEYVYHSSQKGRSDKQPNINTKSSEHNGFKEISPNKDKSHHHVALCNKNISIRTPDAEQQANGLMVAGLLMFSIAAHKRENLLIDGRKQLK